MEAKKTILIIGISSFVGSNLAEFFKKDYKVVGTYKDNPVFIPGILSVPCDVLEKEQVQLVLFAFKPDITIYCAGLSSLTDCAQAEPLADSLNTMGLFNVSEYCQRYRSQVIFISSGYVFGGEEKNYVEMDIPDSTTILGKTKASAEFYIQKTSLNYLIFRCCNLYGRSYIPGQKTTFERLQRKIANNSEAMMDGYVRTGFIDVQYLAMLISMSIKDGASNRLYQVSSKDIMTQYDFAKLYCSVFGIGNSTITRGRWPFPYVASQTSTYGSGDLYYSLDVSNIEGYLNIQMPTVEESLQFTYKRFFGVDKHRSKAGGAGVSFI